MQSSTHLNQVASFQRRNPSSSDNNTSGSAHPCLAVPIQSASDMIVTRLLGSMSSNPGAGSQNLPTLSSFPESLQPAYQDIPDDWFNLDDMEMELSGSREVQEMRVLNDYMLHVYENGPDQINSDDELDDERSVPSESPSEDGRSEFEESRGTPPEPSLGFT